MNPEVAKKEAVYIKPKLRTVGIGGLCPGCHIGIIQGLLSEVINEMGIGGKTMGVTDIGCGSSTIRGVNVEVVPSNHGRSLAVGTGVKRVKPESIVICAIGDGGLAAIGCSHWMNAMFRGEKITCFFVNNAGYGRTGGQMAPTTLLGMKTRTTVYGRDPEKHGFPVHAAEISATIRGTAYSARVSVHTPANYIRAKKAVRAALQKQVDGIGFGIVEFISACPTNWGLSPVECLKFIDDVMLAEFPLGEYKNVDSIDHSVITGVDRISARSGA